MTNANDLDITADLSGTYLKKSDCEHGDYRFVIAAVARETFESRDGKGDQRKIVLTSADNPPRKFSCNKTNLRTLKTWGTLASKWVGRAVWVHWDPTVQMAGNAVGGMRLRLEPATPQTDTSSLEAEIRRLKAQVAATTPAAASGPMDDDGPPPVDDDLAYAMPTLVDGDEVR